MERGLRFVYLVLLTLLLACPLMAVHAPAAGTGREIRCLVFVEGSERYGEHVEALFDEANDYLAGEGIGVELSPCESPRRIEFMGTSSRKMLDELRRAASSSSEPWDLAIAFTTGPLRGPRGEYWAGVIEKRQNRHIIVKCLDRNTLLHEVGHACGLPHGPGIMLPTFTPHYLRPGPGYADALTKSAGRIRKTPRSLRYARTTEN